MSTTENDRISEDSRLFAPDREAQQDPDPSVHPQDGLQTAHLAESTAAAIPLIRSREPRRLVKNQIASSDIKTPGSRWASKLAPFKRLWPPEMASFVVAMVTLAAITALLGAREGKEQPNWPSLLNINSLLSTLTTIFKSALLYPATQGISELKWVHFSKPKPVRDLDRWDAASRGPWGSLQLILQRPGSLLTSLGACIVILSMAIDPFAQQVLKFHTCQQPVDGVFATIPRTNNYTGGTFIFGSSASSAEKSLPLESRPYARSGMSRSLAVALSTGFLDPPANTSSVTPVSCPSANCTFGEPGAGVRPYTSVAVCSDVQDITAELSRNESSGNLALPSGLQLRSDYVLQTRGLESKQSTEDEVIFDFEMIMTNLDCQDFADTGVMTNKTCSPEARAFYIKIFPCIQTYYSPSYVNNVFEEHIMSTTTLPHVNEGYYWSLVTNYSSSPDTDCSPSAIPTDHKTQPALPLESGRLASRSGLPFLGLNATYSYHDPACIYDFARQPSRALRSALEGYFGTHNETGDKTALLFRPAASSSLTGDIRMALLGSTWLELMWRNGTANATTMRAYFDSVMSTLTASIRQEGDPDNSEPIQGTVYEGRTCVGVTWIWLAYPVVVLLLTEGFVMAAIVTSSRHLRPGPGPARGVWKSSALPLLWCGLDDSTRHRMPELGEVDEMEKYSDNVMVKLSTTFQPVTDTKREGGEDDPGLTRWCLLESDAPEVGNMVRLQ